MAAETRHQSSLESLEKHNSVMELELVKARKDSNDTIHKLRDLEEKHAQLQVKMQSLLEKHLSLEDENRVLRQKTVSTSPKINHPGLANSFYEESPTPSKLIVPFSHSLSDSRQTKMTAERHQENEFVVQENHEFLRRCIREDLGFKDGGRRKLYLAILVFQCLGTSMPSAQEWIFLNAFSIFCRVFWVAGRMTQAPKSARAYAGKSSRSHGGVPQQSISSQWDGIIKFLDSLVSHLHENHVPSLFIRMLTTQVFAFINFTMFNSLLIRRECCSFTNGNYWNSGLDELEKWAVNVTEEFSGSSVHKLTHIKQAVRFLLIHQKNKMSLDEITQDLCPALTVMQINCTCKMYWDDTYGTKSVSAEVVEQMREIVHKESQNIKSNSFLLDDDSSFPFLLEDIPKALPEVDTSDVEPPPFLHEYACAQFLIKHEK